MDKILGKFRACIDKYNMIEKMAGMQLGDPVGRIVFYFYGH